MSLKDDYKHTSKIKATGTDLLQTGNSGYENNKHNEWRCSRVTKTIGLAKVLLSDVTQLF